jgi:L-methionine (R)-S-oxide reductase
MSVKIELSGNLGREEKYRLLIPQIVSLVRTESNFIANLANITSALKYAFDEFLWVGFYLYEESENELVLGPFQGRVACTRIKMGKGVCGSSAERRETIIADDVNKFPGHIFCDESSKSEIVIPVIMNDVLYGVLDIDSDKYAEFGSIDKMYLEKLLKEILFIFN